ncbi:hypothetical protein DFH09DRAFT_1325636 [Mycena vulgaris]|nr:hypothetical protein DFH09DRAFT_1325636 [Mycena vulgaris]
MLGELREAEDLSVVMLEKRQKFLGQDHPDTLHAMGNLATAYGKLGKFKEAEELGIVGLEQRRTTQGKDYSPDTLLAMGNLATPCYFMNKFKEVEQLYVELLDRPTALPGADHPDTLLTENYLASTHQAMNNNSQRQTGASLPHPFMGHKTTDCLRKPCQCS